MKRLYIIILFAFITISASGCFNSIKSTDALEEGTGEFKISKEIKTITKEAYKIGCVKDEETARNIADTIFKSLFGEAVENDMPMVVRFDKREQTWQVKTQLPEDAAGGNAYIIIKKRNAEIIGVWLEQ